MRIADTELVLPLGNFDRAKPANLGPAWVTGATSFLGCHVAHQLAGKGYSVVGFARSAVTAEFAMRWGFARVELGRFDANLFRRAFKWAGAPSSVFHAVGSGSVSQAAADPAGDFERTFRSAEQLIDILCRHAPSTRLIYPSSAAVYGNAHIGPIAEEHPTKPISIYGKNKLLTEEMCRERAQRKGLDVVVARLFSVFGPPQRKLLLWELGRRLLSGEKDVTLDGTGDETRDFIHVTGAASAVAILAHAPSVPPIVNVGTGRATSIRTLAALHAAALGVKVNIRFNGTLRVGDPPHQQAGISRLAAMGHTSFTLLEAGLSDYGGWLRKSNTGKNRCDVG
jgi:UDP-glucose 4-epimerase